MADVGERNQGRLGELARGRRIATDLVAIRFVTERFLARLSGSRHAARFALKGAMLHTVWHGDLLRATTDVDLLGLDETYSGRMLGTVLEICGSDAVPADGIAFDAAGASWTRLSGGRIPGDRVIVPARVGKMSVRLKVDVGYGHPVTPGLERRWFPSLLPGYASSPLLCCPKETVVAEKLATAVEFGRDNTRLRDYWDVAELARRDRFAGHLLAEAVQATFASRDAGRFVLREDDYWIGGLRPEYATPARTRQWRGWVRNHAPSGNPEFAAVLDEVIRFAVPLLHAVREGGRQPGFWTPGEGWSRQPRLRDFRPWDRPSPPGSPGDGAPAGDAG